MAFKGTDIDDIIQKMNKEYYNDVLNSFIEKGRFDLILGFAIERKGAVLERDGRIKFMKRVDSYAGTSEFKSYKDAQTEKITALYQTQLKFIKNITPNKKWEKVAAKYVSNKYKALLKSAEDEMLRVGKDWELIAFAARVPLVDVSLFEDRIIESKNSLKILAFAEEVEKANLKKLGKALKQIGNTHTQIVKTEYRGNVEYEEIPIDHIAIFEEKFGKIEEESEK